MPTYEFKCDGCGKDFTVIAGIKEHDTLKPVCPKCKGRKVHQTFSKVNIITSSKSESDDLGGLDDMSDMGGPGGMPDMGGMGDMGEGMGEGMGEEGMGDEGLGDEGI